MYEKGAYEILLANGCLTLLGLQDISEKGDELVIPEDCMPVRRRQAAQLVG